LPIPFQDCNPVFVKELPAQRTVLIWGTEVALQDWRPPPPALNADAVRR
jgi:hypothetical protein